MDVRQRREERLIHLFFHGRFTALRDALLRDTEISRTFQNAKGQTFLFYATMRSVDAYRVCKLLIDEIRVPVGHRDEFHQTVMHYVAKTKNIACLNLLLRRKCEVNPVDRLLRQTPMFYAARFGRAAMCRCLARHRAEISARDAHGRTPLFWARNVELCEEYLRLAGARTAVPSLPLLRPHSSTPKNAGCATPWLNVALDDEGRCGADSPVVQNRPEVACYLALVAEVAQQRHLSWSVCRLLGDGTVVGKDGGSVGADGVDTARARGLGMPVAYTSSVMKLRDVEALLSLEDEFIEDHKVLLNAGGPKAFGAGDIFQQIGLSPSAATRRAVVESLAMCGAKHFNGTTHCTLKCVYFPPNPMKLTGSARARSSEVVGYVYFCVRDGYRTCEDKKDDEALDALANTTAAPKKNASGSTTVLRRRTSKSNATTHGAQATKKKAVTGENGNAKRTETTATSTTHDEEQIGHVVVSHLKVSKSHQRRGIATLLLSGMLQFVEQERPNVRCTALYLTVVKRNLAACEFYRRLGFKLDDASSAAGKEGWCPMALKLDDIAHAADQGYPKQAPTAALRMRWLQMCRGASGAAEVPGEPISGSQLALSLAHLSGPRPSKKRARQRQAAVDPEAKRDAVPFL